jgi:hypothetical protein
MRHRRGRQRIDRGIVRPQPDAVEEQKENAHSGIPV